jgi:hypothetical protein
MRLLRPVIDSSDLAVLLRLALIGALIVGLAAVMGVAVLVFRLVSGIG